MRSLASIAALALAAAALAGCTSEPPASGTTGGATVSSIRITTAPQEAEPESRATVCWRVEGSGTVPHTAVHHDDQSHGTAEATFQDYDGGVAYPGNATAVAASGYALPASFCSSVPVPSSGMVYVRAHAMDGRGGAGKVSDEAAIRAAAPAASPLAVTFAGDVPAEADANGTVMVCWNVAGTEGSVPHTAVHTDTTSHAAAVSFSEYRGQAYYPANATSQAAGGYSVPAEFCTSVQMPSNGTLYVRAHAMQTSPGVLSAEEKAIMVREAAAGAAPGVAVVTQVTWDDAVPSTAPAASQVMVCWRVEAATEGRIPHTAVHADTASHAAEPLVSFQSYDEAAYYPDNATSAASEGYAVPGAFCTSATMPSEGQTLYLRAHAIDGTGGTGRLSLEEKAIAATA